MKRFLLIFGLWSLFAQAQEYANEFLQIGVDASALGQAGSVVAQSNNVFAAYWNPAGLNHLSGSVIGLMHTSLFNNQAQLDYISFAKRKDKESVIAASLIRFGVDNIMNTTQLIDENGFVDYNRITYFSAADYALLISYGKEKILPGLNGGITFKMIYRHIGDFAQAFGFGFDVGLQYKWKKWLAGLVLQDATTTYSYWTFNEQRLQEIRDAVPGQNLNEPARHEISFPKLQVGIARHFRFTDEYGLSAELDLRTYFSERKELIQSKYFSLAPALGVQGDYRKKIFLRLGIKDLYKTRIFNVKHWQITPTAGLGIRFKYLSLDYAFSGFQNRGLFQHVFSLQLDLKIFEKK